MMWPASEVVLLLAVTVAITLETPQYTFDSAGSGCILSRHLLIVSTFHLLFLFSQIILVITFCYLVRKYFSMITESNKASQFPTSLRSIEIQCYFSTPASIPTMIGHTKRVGICSIYSCGLQSSF